MLKYMLAASRNRTHSAGRTPRKIVVPLTCRAKEIERAHSVVNRLWVLAQQDLAALDARCHCVQFASE